MSRYICERVVRLVPLYRKRSKSLTKTLSSCTMFQAVIEPNFRYTGARLAHRIEEECPFFRSELALLCEEQVKENGNNPDILMFLADLYSQFRCDTYAVLVIESILKVLSTDVEEHIKPVCQALKVLLRLWWVWSLCIRVFVSITVDRSTTGEKEQRSCERDIRKAAWD